MDESLVYIPKNRPVAVSNGLDFPWAFFEKAKYEFLYVSNDERSSLVNDKKDRPIEQ